MGLSRCFLALVLVGACSAEDGNPPAGDPAHGDPSAGDPAHGDPSAGDPAHGDPSAGDPAHGDPAAGDPAPGDDGGGDPGATGPLCLFPDTVIFPAPAIGTSMTSAFSFGTVSVVNCSGAITGVNAPYLSQSTDPELAIEFLPFSGTASLMPWETVLVELRFAPEDVGEFGGELVVPYGPSDSVSVPLSAASIADPGTCMLQLGPTLLSADEPLVSAMQVEPTPAGAPVNDTFMLVNISRTSCTVTSFGLTGDAAFSFPYSNQVQTPTTLAFRQMRLINLRFGPDSAGDYSATVTVTGDDGTHTMSVSAFAY